MKNKHILLCLAAAAIIGTACSDDFLAVKPLSLLTPESALISDAGLEALLNQMCKHLRSDYYENKGQLCCELVLSDMAVSAYKDASAPHNFDVQLTPNAEGLAYDFFSTWTRGYNQTRNANTVLQYVDKADISEARKNEIKAEALFHRSFWFFRLVNTYGDVPFMSKNYTSPKSDFRTHDRKTILKKIQEDMEWAVQYLPEEVSPGRINRAAGNHLLAKICTENFDFEGAVRAATAVINDGHHALMTQRFGSYASDPEYDVIWDLHQCENKSLSNNTEGILVVQDRYGLRGATSGGTEAMSRYTPNYWNAAYLLDPAGKRGMIDTKGNPYVIKWGRGVGYVRPCSYYNYEVWQNCGADLRHDTKHNWFTPDMYVYNNPSSKYYGQPVQKSMIKSKKDTIHCWFPWPFYKVYVKDEIRPDQPYGGNGDWYLFRIAETYLIRAEAYWWLGKTDLAANDINAIRTRALAPPVAASDVTLDYILDERARELYTEEFRHAELARIAFMMAEKGLNGYSLDNFSEKNYWYDRVMAKNELYRPGNIMWGTAVFKVSPYHVLWPIPENAIVTNVGGVINQNQGYPGCEKNEAPLTVIDDSQ